jgi:hypothetical protein
VDAPVSTENGQYRVLYLKDGQEILTDPEPMDLAKATAQRLDREGHEVHAVLTEYAARDHLRTRYNESLKQAPMTYRGVAVPDDLRGKHARAREQYAAWKRGVDAELDRAKPAASEPKDFQWVIRIHWDAEHTSPAVGPFGQTEADRKMRELRRRYRDAGQTPPKMTRELLRAPDVLDSWIESRTEEDDPLRGPVCVDPGCPAGYRHHGPCPGEEDR